MNDTPILSQTKRITVPLMEEILGIKFPVGPNGFIQVVDYLGTDKSIVDAARVSYAGGGNTVKRSDEGLLRYLMRHQHTSPFEFAEIVIHVRAPLYIARQWYRHRTANVNEISGRYSILDRGYYIPEKLPLQCKHNKHTRSNESPANEKELLDLMKQSLQESETTYTSLIEEGVIPELARGVLPMASYTEFSWKIDLHNLLKLIRLRIHHTSQAEFNTYAKTLIQIVSKWVPLTWKAFEDYQLNAISLSPMALACIQKYYQGEEVSLETSGMSKGEWQEFEEDILPKIKLKL